MKTLKLKSMTFIFTLLLIISCSKDDKMETVLQNDEAMEVVQTSLQKSTSGFNEEIEKSAMQTNEDYSQNATCGEIYQDSFTNNYEGEFVNSNYNLMWQYTLLCSNINVPQSLDLNASSSGFYQTEHIASVDQSESNLLISGIEPSNSNYTFSGDYKREGTQELNFLQSRSLTSTIKLAFDAIVVDKETYQIQSGSATVTLYGTNANNQSFEFNGDVVFTGNRTAILTLNGTTYNIDLN